MCYKDPVFKDHQWSAYIDRSPGASGYSEVLSLSSVVLAHFLFCFYDTKYCTLFDVHMLLWLKPSHLAAWSIHAFILSSFLVFN